MQTTVKKQERGIEDLKKQASESEDSKGEMTEDERLRNTSQEGTQPVKMMTKGKL